MHSDTFPARRSMGRAGLAAALLCALLMAGCAGPTPLLSRGKPSGPQWPEAPQAARIEWIKSVATPVDAGIAKSFWARALELVTGTGKPQIVRPYGVIYDAGGRLIVADPGAGVVHLMDTGKQSYLRIAGGDALPLRSPIGLAEDAANHLYITDSAANAVYRYDLANHVLAPFLPGMRRPTGIAYNKVNKLLYISETSAHRVVAVDLAGAVKFSFGGQAGDGANQLNLPTDLATDSKGQVYVSDPLNYKIKIFTPEGVLVDQFGEMGDGAGELNKPKGIALDARGNVFMSDALLDAVQIFDDRGRFLFSFGGVGSGDGSFWMPSGVCIQGEYVFVADTFNQRIQVFRYLLDGQKPAPRAAPVQQFKGE